MWGYLLTIIVVCSTNLDFTITAEALKLAQGSAIGIAVRAFSEEDLTAL